MDIETAVRVLGERAEEAEVFHLKGSTSTLTVKKDLPDLFKESIFSGYGLRVIDKEREGFAYSNTLSMDVIEGALKAAKVASPDPFVGLPGPARFKEVGGCFDERVATLDPEEAAGFARELVEPCREMEASPTTGGISWSSSHITIASTHGLLAADRETSISAHLAAIARDTETQSGFHYDVSRSLDLDFREVGHVAARLARESLGGKRVGTKTLDVTLKPHATAELLEATLVPSFIADNVQRGRSLLADRTGEEVFSEGLTIHDIGNLDGGIMSAAFDGEGVPTRKTPLVEKGVVKGFLYDSYTAAKEERESTGNADRPTHSVPPRIQATNFVISGKGDIEEGGLLVHGLIGAHTCNPVTGDFSVETRNAFLDGKPVKRAIITGNVFELLKKIKGFGDDPLQVSSVRSPSLQFGGVRVVG
jgi:PmbA protein